MTRWRMTAYDLAAGARFEVAAGACAFAYASDAPIVADGVAIDRAAGAFCAEGQVVTAPRGAWLFEIAPGSDPVRDDAGLCPVLSRVTDLEPGAYLIRADRVESDAGARTPAHRHRGPGIRRLERGRLLAEVGGHLDRIEAGQAWFETGRETVVGVNINDGSNAFIRVMLLPAELAGGKSSFIAATAQDLAKPRGARLTLFGERPLAG